MLSASKSYSERLFRYSRIDRLPREAADQALVGPAAEEECEFTPDALDEMYAITAGYPYFIQAYGKVVWDVAPSSPVTAQDIRVAAPEAESELAVGFFGSRYERATPAEREYLRAMADAALLNPVAAERTPSGSADDDATSAAAYGMVGEREAVPTSAVAEVLGRKPQSLSPARDALIKKGLIYSGERGLIAFTVPHFGRYLRTNALAG